MAGTQQVDVIILGAGAAGLMCAACLAPMSLSVAVVDQAARIGGKIHLAGGGMANFTNRCVAPENYSSENPHFCRSALARFTPDDFLAMLHDADIAYEERDHGRLFCRHGAGQIVQMLERRCAAGKVRFLLKTMVGGVHADEHGFTVDAGVVLQGKYLVVALGSPCWPQTGATDVGYHLARQFGLKMVSPRPVLAPLLFPSEQKKMLAELTGIAVPAAVSCCGHRFEENVLWTHHGLSGPAILQASLYWQRPTSVHIDWWPGGDIGQAVAEQRAANGKVVLETVLARYMPQRLADLLCRQAGAMGPCAQASASRLAVLQETVHAWRFVPCDTAGYAKAEAVAGGVDTHQLDSKTMMARAYPGLFFIGEVMDVTGQLGGYNLHWAWASAYAAAQALLPEDL